jgi:cell division protein FtsB
MNLRAEPKLRRHSISEGLALAFLLVMAGMALVGPSGLMAWSENNRLLEQRQAEVKVLLAQRAELRNRVALLDPRNTDPDLAGELVRKDLNVVHPDEVLLLLK